MSIHLILFLLSVATAVLTPLACCAESAANSDAPREAGEEAAAAEANPAASGAAAASATVAEKPKARRKSGVSGTVKKLNKKGSKVKILHLDAKPGDHYFVKLRGYPQWPVVVCSEDMLPQQLIKTRPVSAARTDGSYREDFADGGKRVADRTYPVMYLQTNELYVFKLHWPIFLCHAFN